MRGGPAAALAVGAVVLAVAGAGIAPVFPALEVREQNTGKVLYMTPIAPGEQFEVGFVHSVERTPVREVFETGQDLSIYLVETVYESFGAGLPTMPDEQATLVVKGGVMRIIGLRRKIGRLFLAVSPVPGHELTVREQRVDLADLARPGTGLDIRVVREPGVTLFFGRRCRWTRTKG